MLNSHIIVFGLDRGALEEILTELRTDHPNVAGTTKIDELSTLLAEENFDAIVIAGEVAGELLLAVKNLLVSQGLDLHFVQARGKDDVRDALLSTLG